VRATIGQIRSLLRGVRQMREPGFYQEIVNEGRVEGRVQGRAEEARRVAIRLGTQRFGAPSATVVARLGRSPGADVHALSKYGRLVQVAA
jgi:predicted transposase YdaD